MADQYPITQEEFRAWLETFPPYRLCGNRRDISDNPLTRYLKARGDRAVAGGAWVLADGKEYGTPEWARLFLFGIARESRPYCVTARTALRLLDRVSEVAS